MLFAWLSDLISSYAFIVVELEWFRHSRLIHQPSHVPLGPREWRTALHLRFSHCSTSSLWCSVQHGQRRQAHFVMTTPPTALITTARWPSCVSAVCTLATIRCSVVMWARMSPSVKFLSGAASADLAIWSFDVAASGFVADAVASVGYNFPDVTSLDTTLQPVGTWGPLCGFLRCNSCLAHL
jgi:hypothetical protein